jgi:antitoxin (DNA-binding transcriptional repressor) of toxin-antitoxin stability system
MNNFDPRNHTEQQLREMTDGEFEDVYQRGAKVFELIPRHEELDRNLREVWDQEGLP